MYVADTIDFMAVFPNKVDNLPSADHHRVACGIVGYVLPIVVYQNRIFAELHNACFKSTPESRSASLKLVYLNVIRRIGRDYYPFGITILLTGTSAIGISAPVGCLVL